MNRTTCAWVLALALLSPLALAAPPQKAAEGGLSQACRTSGNERPCGFSRVITDTTVGPGETKTYSNGTYDAEGTVHVAAGGTVEVANATLVFASTSEGFVLDPGATLRVTDSALRADEQGSPFGVLAAASSTLRIARSSVEGGTGVEVWTDDALIQSTTLRQIPVALRLRGVTLTIAGNVFLNNTVAVNQTGGMPTLEANYFQGGLVCVQDYETNPTIVNNTFRGCHVGIHHKKSHSYLALNDMEDDGDPPGGGIVVEDTNSPIIEGNRIANYGTGIIVKNARAWIRNNTITENHGNGVYVQSNTGPMDVTSNVITQNGGAGVRLVNASDVEVAENVIEDNGADGIHVEGSQRVILGGNDVLANGGHGVITLGTPGVVVEDNFAYANLGTGIRVEGSPAASVHRNNATQNGQNGFFSTSDFVSFAENSAWSNAHSGFVLLGSINATFHEDIAAENGIDGFGLVNATNALLQYALSEGNLRHGYRVEVVGGHAFYSTTASRNGLDGYHVNSPDDLTVLSYARAFENGRDGVRNVEGNATLAQNGWWEGNVHAGVANLDPNVHIDARFSYWGSENGPTVPDGDPEGGDAIDGNVLYEPYATSPPSPAFAVE